eukprot:1988240-Rhodomonas_salina.1
MPRYLRRVPIRSTKIPLRRSRLEGSEISDSATCCVEKSLLTRGSKSLTRNHLSSTKQSHLSSTTRAEGDADMAEKGFATALVAPFALSVPDIRSARIGQ